MMTSRVFVGRQRRGSKVLLSTTSEKTVRVEFGLVPWPLQQPWECHRRTNQGKSQLQQLTKFSKTCSGLNLLVRLNSPDHKQGGWAAKVGWRSPRAPCFGVCPGGEGGSQAFFFYTARENLHGRSHSAPWTPGFDVGSLHRAGKT